MRLPRRRHTLPALRGSLTFTEPSLCVARRSTIKSVRKLVNGSAGILDSLSFRGGVIPPNLEAAYRARRFDEVVLDEPPLAVNVRVGGMPSPKGSAPGSAPGSVLWHGIELDDLSGLITSLTNGAQVISLLVSRSAEKAELTGFVAAQNNVADVVLVYCFAYMLAFALTDFKLRKSLGRRRHVCPPDT